MRFLIHILMLTLTMGAFAAEFQLPLSFTNAQVDKLILGCVNGASDGYDKGKDILVPPFGMNTAVIGFVVNGKKELLYRDLRAPKYPAVWTIRCTVAPNRRSVVSWNAEQLPSDAVFTIKIGNGNALDMRTIQKLTIAKSADIIVTATPKTIPEQPSITP